MSVTPYSDLTTQDILSAHISGLSHSINKIEETLNMKTKLSTFELYPVTNQEEVSLRYRIYEGEIRNWLSFSLKRNGLVVPEDEYEAQPAFGVVVFNSPQLQTSTISVEATHIISKSGRLDSIELEVSSLSKSQVKLSDLKVGGRNLILKSPNFLLKQSDHGNTNSSVFKEDYVEVTCKNGGNVFNGNDIFTSELRKTGETYTISFEVNTKSSMVSYFYPSERYASIPVPNTNGYWKKISFTYTQTGPDSDAPVLFGFGNVLAGSVIKYRNLMLEKSNVPSDHVLAQESFAKVEELQKVKDEINNIGSGGGVSLRDLGLIKLRKPEIISNIRPQFGGDPGKFDANSILMGSINIDSFPVIITETTTISKMSITFSVDSTSANNLLGIYSNDESKTAPSKLIASTAIFRYENTVQETKDIPLTSPITLEPGIYWMARWSNDAVKLEGHISYPEKFISIIPPHGLYESNRIGQNNGTSYAIGVRTGSIGYVTSLPTTFPTLNGTDAFYLIRSSQGTIKLLV